jgi:hypothetical protein
MHRFQYSLTPAPVHPAILSFLRARVQASFAVAEKHLADRAFILGNKPTIADFSLAGYVYYPGGDRLRYHDGVSGAPCLAPAPRSAAGLEVAIRTHRRGNDSAGPGGRHRLDRDEIGVATFSRPGRSAARGLRAGVHSPLHGVVFAIFCPGPALRDESIQLQHIML